MVVVVVEPKHIQYSLGILGSQKGCTLRHSHNRWYLLSLMTGLSGPYHQFRCNYNTRLYRLAVVEVAVVLMML